MPISKGRLKKDGCISFMMSEYMLLGIDLDDRNHQRKSNDTSKKAFRSTLTRVDFALRTEPQQNPIRKIEVAEMAIESAARGRFDEVPLN